MKDKNNHEFQDLENEDLETLEKDEDLTTKSKDYDSDDVVYEDVDEDGEIMSDTRKIKHDKDKLKEKCEEKIKRLEKERDEYLRGWQRIQADYKNREKELEIFKKDFTKYANIDLIKNILPVLDGYDSAKSHTEHWEKVDKDWRTGVEYLFSQLEKVLSQNGVVAFGKIGDEYDPNSYEAVENTPLKVEDKEKSGKIVNVLQKGYKLGDKLLRPARVKVGIFEE